MLSTFPEHAATSPDDEAYYHAGAAAEEEEDEEKDGGGEEVKAEEEADKATDTDSPGRDVQAACNILHALASLNIRRHRAWVADLTASIRSTRSSQRPLIPQVISLSLPLFLSFSLHVPPRHSTPVATPLILILSLTSAGPGECGMESGCSR